MNRTLIHLVSGERIQNLLPILALDPTRVIQICSDDPNILSAAQHTENAAQQAGSRADFQIHKLPNSTPSVDDVRHAHKQLISIYPGAIVNITGGTKLMSLGAYLGASEFPDSPILYCDTANRRFVQVGDCPLPTHMLTFSDVSTRLTVAIVMAAQGKKFTADIITPELLAFGKTAWDLHVEHHDQIKTWTADIRKEVPRDQNGRIEKSKTILRQFIEKPLPFPQCDPALDYLDAAVQAGLINVDNSGNCRMIATADKSAIERISNLLDGAWLELAVAEMAQHSGRYGDVRWSVQPASDQDKDYGETDLIAVDRSSLNLVVISCKTSTEFLSTLEHISSWRDRTRTLGGSHASGHLCLFRAKNADQAMNMKNMARSMSVKFHIGEEIPHHFTTA